MIGGGGYGYLHMHSGTAVQKAAAASQTASSSSTELKPTPSSPTDTEAPKASTTASTTADTTDTTASRSHADSEAMDHQLNAPSRISSDLKTLAGGRRCAASGRLWRGRPGRRQPKQQCLRGAVRSQGQSRSAAEGEHLGWHRSWIVDAEDRPCLSSHCQNRSRARHGGDSGQHLQERINRESACGQRPGNVASGGSGRGQELALQALYAERRACRCGNDHQCKLRAGWMSGFAPPPPFVDWL